MDYGALADDFFVNLDLQTSLALPDSRETVLHFCEAVQRQFPDMTQVYQRPTGEFVLEGDRTRGSYQWMELQTNRLSAGFFNPPAIDQGVAFHDWLLERSKYYLGVAGLDVEAVDVMFGWNLDFRGNRDALVGETLLSDSPMAALCMEAPARTVEFQPSLIVALTEDCFTQARLSLETRGGSYQIRTGTYDDEPISIYFTVRQYPRPGEVLEVRESFARQVEMGEDLVTRMLIPQVIRPLAEAISAAQ
jgi:hypothetical protein